MIHIQCDTHEDIIALLKKAPQLVDEVLSNNIKNCDWQDFNDRCFLHRELKIGWSLDLVLKYKDHLYFSIQLSENSNDITVASQEDYKLSSRNNDFDMEWTTDFIDTFIDKWDWNLFSILFPIRLTQQILEKYSKYWNIELLKKNQEIKENEDLNKYITKCLRTIITAGANVVYGDKLRDEKWKSKSDEIKKRDSFQCVRCKRSRKLIELECFDDLKSFLDGVEIENFNEIKRCFDERRELLLCKNKTSCRIEKKEKTSIKGIYSYNILYSPPCVFSPPIYYRLLSTNNLNDIVEIQYGEPKAEIKFKAKDKLSKNASKLGLQYYDQGNTNDRFILCQCLDWGNEHNYALEFRGQGILTYNQYSIIFPLYELDLEKMLEVHHKIYKKRSGEYIEPWEYKDEDLETLCHSCHIYMHEQPIQVIEL